MEAFVKFACEGAKSESEKLRNAALFAIGQFAEFLEVLFKLWVLLYSTYQPAVYISSEIIVKKYFNHNIFIFY